MITIDDMTSLAEVHALYLRGAVRAAWCVGEIPEYTLCASNVDLNDTYEILVVGDCGCVAQNANVEWGDVRWVGGCRALVLDNTGRTYWLD